MFLARTNYMYRKIGKLLIDRGLPFHGHFGQTEKQLNLYNATTKLRREKEQLIAEEAEELLDAYPEKFSLIQKKKLKQCITSDEQTLLFGLEELGKSSPLSPQLLDAINLNLVRKMFS